MVDKDNYTVEYINAIKKLTRCEIKVLDKIAEGYTSKEIAEILNNSPRTIEKHRENINRKLNFKQNDTLSEWCEEFVSKT